MIIKVLIEFPLRSGKLEELCKLLKNILIETRAFSGCLKAETCAATDESSVILIEEWESRSDHENYLAWRIETGLIKALEPYVSAPPTISYFSPRKE
tara:strand:+ start:276 stop:566 length:291 start_codon:yes stop_codon:yes gene_type:complete